MSLHVTLSPEAVARLRAQRRNSTISSVVIAFLSVALVALLLGYLLLPVLTQEPPVIAAYTDGSLIDEPRQDPVKPTHHLQKPSSPAPSLTRVITANTQAALAIPALDAEFATPSLEFGGDGTFGDGWTEGDGGRGGGGMFGSSSRASGGLEGRLYDFKKNTKGEDIPYDLANRSEFVDRVLRLQKSNFSESSLSRHFSAPNSLFLTHLAIPLTDAASGPKFFGAEKTIKPSGWMVHYRGRVTVPKSGFYRFSGLGDDYIVVMINGRMRLAACWGDIQDAVDGRWDPSKPTGDFKSPFSGMRLVYGDWVNLKSGDTLDLDIAIGERPGGKVGFVLHIEEKGVSYRKAPDGRPILPLFATAPLPEDETERITRECGAYEFEWDKMPVFPVK